MNCEVSELANIPASTNTHEALREICEILRKIRTTISHGDLHNFRHHLLYMADVFSAHIWCHSLPKCPYSSIKGLQIVWFVTVLQVIL